VGRTSRYFFLFFDTKIISEFNRVVSKKKKKIDDKKNLRFMLVSGNVYKEGNK